MSFQWLEMRIQEEKDRRHREAQILERLPRILEDLHRTLAACVKEYGRAFGSETADIVLLPTKIRVTVREPRDGKWLQTSKVDVTIVPTVPGFQIDRGEVGLVIEVGLLPGDQVFYRDREQDKYLTLEELTRRILDRAFFPKLQE